VSAHMGYKIHIFYAIKLRARYLHITLSNNWSISYTVVAKLSSMEMFDVGPTLGASIAHLSRTEVPWVGSTSGATVANVSNIDVFEVGANIVLLSKLRSRTPTLDKRVARSRLSNIFAG